MADTQERDYQKGCRLDVNFEIVKDEQTGRESLVAHFDLDRYEIREFEGKRFLFDRFDRWMMPLGLVQQMITEALSRQPTGTGQCLGNAREYVKERRASIPQLLKQQPARIYEHVDRSEEVLASLPDGVHGFAVISLDIVGSTQLSNSLDAGANARVVGIVLAELARVVPFFHAQILKFTGDGILAYVPPPSFLTANDNAIDCALTMRGLIRDAVNPSLQEVGLPIIDVRVGIESGAAVAITVGHPSSKQHRDLIGQTLNLACKIQASAAPGEIRLGQIAYQNLHTMWRKGCQTVPLAPNWPYSLFDGRRYPIYSFVAKGAILESAGDVPPLDRDEAEEKRVRDGG